MSWKLDSDRPIHKQLLEVLLTGIVSGIYPSGSKLPSVRDLAMEAGVNPNTMQRAFTELEQKGLVRTERTAGRFVTDDREMIERSRDTIATQQLTLFLDKMQQLGFQKKEIVSFMRSKIEEEKNE